MKARTGLALGVFCLASAFTLGHVTHAAQAAKKGAGGRWATDAMLARMQTPPGTATGNTIMFELTVDANNKVTGYMLEPGAGPCGYTDTKLKIDPPGTVDGKNVTFSVNRPQQNCPPDSPQARGGGAPAAGGGAPGAGGGGRGRGGAGGPGGGPGAGAPPPGGGNNFAQAQAALTIPSANQPAIGAAGDGIQINWTLTLSDDEQSMSGMRGIAGGGRGAGGGAGRGGRGGGAGGPGGGAGGPGGGAGGPGGPGGGAGGFGGGGGRGPGAGAGAPPPGGGNEFVAQAPPAGGGAPGAGGGGQRGPGGGGAPGAGGGGQRGPGGGGAPGAGGGGQRGPGGGGGGAIVFKRF